MKFLSRQLTMSETSRLIFDHPLKQWPTAKKRKEKSIEKFEYLKNKKHLYNFLKATIWRKFEKQLTEALSMLPAQLIYTSGLESSKISINKVQKQEKNIEGLCLCDNTYLWLIFVKKSPRRIFRRCWDFLKEENFFCSSFFTGKFNMKLFFQIKSTFSVSTDLQSLNCRKYH